jgi:hypothetical protein
LAKLKTKVKRAAPAKSTKPVPNRKPDPEGYQKLSNAIIHGRAGGLKNSKKPNVAESMLDTLKQIARYPERKPEKPPEPEPPKIDVTVRSIYYGGQYLPALCFRRPGQPHVPCVAGDTVNGIRKFTVPLTQHDKSPILEHGYGNLAAPYTPERFASHMRRIAAAAPVSPEARALLLPYAPDMPSGPSPATGPAFVIEQAGGPLADVYRSEPSPRSARKAATGPSRTGGKELIRSLAATSGLPPEKVRAKLRAAGMRAPYTDESACRKALGVKK